MPSKKPQKSTPVKSVRKAFPKPATTRTAAKRPTRRAATPRVTFEEPVITERLSGTVTPPPAVAPVAALETPTAQPVTAVPPPAPEPPKTEVRSRTAAEKAGISGEELYKRIQFEAYLLGERDGFKADPVHYWIQAERAVKKALNP
jgi:hypothetical protein